VVNLGSKGGQPAPPYPDRDAGPVPRCGGEDERGDGRVSGEDLRGEEKRGGGGGGRGEGKGGGAGGARGRLRSAQIQLMAAESPNAHPSGWHLVGQVDGWLPLLGASHLAGGRVTAAPPPPPPL